METLLAISFFVLGVVYITYIAVSSMIKVLHIAHERKEISQQKQNLLTTVSVAIGISIAILLSTASIKLLGFLI